MENELTGQQKRGYLHKDFAIFHLKDRKNIEFEFHYHEFNKIIVFLSGRVVYHIEGKAYKLKPGDILLVNSSEIHKPMIDTSEVYERMVLWVNGEFLEQHNTKDCNLLSCFALAAQNRFNLLRLAPELLFGIKQTLCFLEEAAKDQAFGSEILKNALFLQFMVGLNRAFLGIDSPNLSSDVEYDETIGQVIDYITGNLAAELTMDHLAAIFYTSKYYLMRKFKQQTGYTIHNYILQKRLIAANALIKDGKSLSIVYVQCGFGDYSNFVRAYKKMFGVSPKQHYKKGMP